jgi:hypothetical protein
MDFATILLLIDKTIRLSVGIEKTNEFLVEFMSRSVSIGALTKTDANVYLSVYRCRLPETCWGCLENQPNQMAHIDPGGCLYEE